MTRWSLFLQTPSSCYTTSWDSTPEVEAATISSFSCGDTITDNVLLTGDVVCPASFDAAPTSGRAAVIGASNIVIDGNGHTFDYSAGAGVSFGLGTAAAGISSVTIKNLTFVGSGNHAVFFQGDDLSVLSNMMPNGKVALDGVGNATIDGNTITPNAAWPASALSIANVPGNSTYSITNNTLTNPSAIGLNIGKVENPGMALTLEGNTFDGSVWGAVLNNIKGPFTLSHTNSFARAGHTGGYPLSISGVDLTVDG